ncbi:small secreted protein [Streptomyces actinomycinicus]|uniref:Small secreted protein n=1 Tax=Streptomyces actinomycinicus TaxID=1695166 RepID=A0A937ELV7_9ACTN|nr:small secreted protein [Streptomyces actinomycinicus]MBL1085668.1 small secreted protein [Streptomyces actinomycinicus]
MEGTDPVNKKLAAALSGGAVLVVALSGCSSDSEAKGPDPKLVAWAKTVCDAVPVQDAKIKAANAAISTTAADTAKPETLQKTDSKAFQDMADGYKAIAAAISGAGTPPGVEGGAKRQQDVVKNLNSLADSYADLKKQVDALNTKDQGKFAAGLRDVATQMTELEKQHKSGVEALKNLQQGEVKEAIAEQASCKKVASSAAPSTGTTTGSAQG